MLDIDIRVARSADMDELARLDTVVPRDPAKAEFILQWVEAGECYVAEGAGRIVGYGVINYQFFHDGNVDMLMIHPDFRGQGVGRKLLRHLEALCRTENFWVTTNLSNQPMQRLLASEGFKLSGFVDNLDERDPELIFFKSLGKLGG